MEKIKQASRRKFHFIYKTTNIVNGKYYIGMHSTDDLEDGYMGSGTRVCRSINKHGKDNHQVEVLEFLPDRESLKKRELELVNEEKLTDKMCMNLALGGDGGWFYVNQQNLNGFSQKDVAIKAACIVNKIRSKRHVEKLQDPSYKESWLKAKVDGIKTYYDNGGINSMKDKHHSIDTKNIMRLAKCGDKNPNSGKMWITNGVESTMILKTDIIPTHWIKGRTVK